MELDDLKKAWQKMDASQGAKSADQIKRMINQQSKSMLDKIRMNMFLDILVGVIVVIAAIAFIVYQRHSTLSTPGLVLFGVLFVGWIGLAYPRLYKNTNSRPRVGNALSHLNEKIASLEKDLEFYRTLNIYMYPLAVVVGLILDNATLDVFKNMISDNYVPVLFVVLAFTVIFPLYVLFVKWWTKFMYGRFVNRLKQMHAELIHEEELL